ncbi:tetratricopeptide repeat protein [Lysobacter sp. SG-8]|uniref:Ancillary SecYEG translocon subunit n=1 Tax=Marilutibacter penaei TaxID=2759900 RepID=A0A7W3U2B0_9GAMM|nr:tetratricopeptide repeat protein [Lysobacter penaei]MBB1087653.1 tetratricopeptide repeat protein [Lysobacter penaei]
MAIDDILDEHEQGERVQQWLRSNALGLFGGVALGLAAIGGWKWYERDSLQKQYAEADRYNAATEAIEAGDDDAATRTQALEPGVLSTLATLQLAKSQAEAGDFEAAIASLRDAQSGDAALQAVIDLRIARLLIQTEQAAEAKALLVDAEDANALEVRGDAEYALGETDAARTSYEAALAKMDVGSPMRRMLELKLSEVGGTPAGDDEAQS